MTRTFAVTALLLAVGAGLLGGDWLPGACMIVLAVGWAILYRPGQVPVLAMAFTYQWVEVCSGVFYHLLTGRSVRTMQLCDYRPMVMIGLLTLLSLTGGLACGRWALPRNRLDRAPHSPDAFRWPPLIGSYLVSLPLLGFLNQFGWQIPQLQQAMLAMTTVQLGLLYLMFRRLVRPRIQWRLFFLLLIAAVMQNAIGFFAGFREPLILATLALVEVFDRRRVSHWLGLAGLSILIVVTGTIWSGVKGEYRAEIRSSPVFAESVGARADLMGALVKAWFDKDWEGAFRDLDNMADRMWQVYYPALAVQRVPAEVPHENGQLLRDALWHTFTPRLLFPDKAVIASESHKVRKYAGVWVSAEESDTNIAFGYAAESYVDFGVPGMFLPIFAFGLLMGAAYAALHRLIRHRDLCAAATTVIFWLSLYLFERSELKTVGLAGTLLIYLGGGAYLLNRYLLSRRKHLPSTALNARRMAAGPTPGA